MSSMFTRFNDIELHSSSVGYLLNGLQKALYNGETYSTCRFVWSVLWTSNLLGVVVSMLIYFIGISII